MTSNQSLKIYEILSAEFSQPQKARDLTEAIEAVVNEKVDSSNVTLKSILSKDLEIVWADMKSEFSKTIADVKSELSKTIYIVGLVQFLAIVGSVMGMLAFMNR